MKNKSYLILILTFVVVLILFLLPHDEKRNFDSVDTDYLKRFKTISFGHYEQDNDPNTKNEEIEWLVLKEENDKALVISNKTIIYISFHSESRNITWEDSLLRAYLNNVFYEESFTDLEKQMIIKTKLINSKNNEFGLTNGNDTYDNIFVLNNSEYNKYFISNLERVSAGTPYAKSLGLSISMTLPIDENPIKNGTYYWSRDVGYHASDIACINWDGEINKYGYDCRTDGMGVRPCMWIKKEGVEKWQKK